MSSQETKKSAAKFGKFGSKKPSAFKVPKLTKSSDDSAEAPAAVSVDSKPAGDGALREADRTEELPDEELLDDSDLEALDDSDLEDDGETTEAGIASGVLEVAPATVKMPASERPVDPYGATEALSADQVSELQAHRARADGVVAGELPGVSVEPLASSPPLRPSSADEAVAALDGLGGDTATVEDSLAGMQAQPAPAPITPPPGAMMSPPPGAMSPPPGAMSPPQQPAIPTPFPAGPPPAAPQTPAPGSMAAARNASWKEAHPSARRWARRRDATGGARRTPSPSRIGAGLILVGIGIYLLAIFIPAHRPDGPREAERTEAGKVWRFTETQHSLAAALAFGFVGLGLFGAVRGAVYRREVTTRCKRCQMQVEATREGMALKCPNGGHRAGLAMSSIAMLAAFAAIGLSTLALLLSASLG